MNYALLLIPLIFIGMLLEDEIIIYIPFIIIIISGIVIFFIGIIYMFGVITEHNYKINILIYKILNKIIIIGILFIRIIIILLFFIFNRYIQTCNRWLHFITDIFYTGPTLIAVVIGIWFIFAVRSVENAPKDLHEPPAQQ